MTDTAEQEHTPLGWVVDADIQATFEDGRSECVFEITNADHSETYAYAAPEYARYIVKAANLFPELVEVVETTLRVLARKPPMGCALVNVPGYRCLFDACKAILAKAGKA